MNARLRTLFGYGILIGAMVLFSLVWPEASRIILAGLGWFNAFLLAAVIAGIVWIFAGPAIDRLAEAWRAGYPTALHASRDDPPWQSPRRVSSSGSAQERADFRRLRARLTELPGPVPEEILRGIGRSDAPRNAYFDPVLYRDSETGQHWVEDGYEVGLNQWTDFIPVRMPD